MILLLLSRVRVYIISFIFDIHPILNTRHCLIHLFLYLREPAISVLSSPIGERIFLIPLEIYFNYMGTSHWKLHQWKIFPL